ncbi:MAG: hypothetical protein NZ992_00135 [Candidatus Korarchaeum sp.]|nr:hypothetical protein [Candidatus Korarchaeum sp.]MDW8093329.1 hypothetical protein [Nitrososphaerota archaeon]
MSWRSALRPLSKSITVSEETKRRLEAVKETIEFRTERRMTITGTVRYLVDYFLLTRDDARSLALPRVTGGKRREIFLRRGARERFERARRILREQVGRPLTPEETLLLLIDYYRAREGIRDE